MKLKIMRSQERKNRIIARGEHSNHCHVIVGNAIIERKDDKVIINVEDGGAIMKHLLESDWVQGNEVWTKEHNDIELEKGTYEFIQQTEYDSFEKVIRQVMD